MPRHSSSRRASQERFPAGKVAISVANNGSETHELVIIRASDAADLPKKADDSVDEDTIPESKKVGELTAQETKTATFDLSAGDYIAFCNLVEDMGMNDDSGMGTGGGMGGGGMEHVRVELGMVNYFTVA